MYVCVCVCFFSCGSQMWSLNSGIKKHNTQLSAVFKNEQYMATRGQYLARQQFPKIYIQISLL